MNDDTKRLLVKTLERYKNRLQEVETMGWYKDETVTQNEIARVDGAMADLNKQLSAPTHADERITELVKSAQEAWTVWDNRPRLISGDRVNPRSRLWMMAQRVAMNDLGAALLLVGADLRTTKEKEVTP